MTQRHSRRQRTPAAHSLILCNCYNHTQSVIGHMKRPL